MSPRPRELRGVHNAGAQRRETPGSVRARAASRGRLLFTRPARAGVGWVWGANRQRLRISNGLWKAIAPLLLSGSGTWEGWGGGRSMGGGEAPSPLLAPAWCFLLLPLGLWGTRGGGGVTESPLLQPIPSTIKLLTARVQMGPRGKNATRQGRPQLKQLSTLAPPRRWSKLRVLKRCPRAESQAFVDAPDPENPSCGWSFRGYSFSSSRPPS